MAVVGSRREARERALGLGYELEVREISVDDLLDQQLAPPDDYAVRLVRGVEDNHTEIDALLRKFSEHWALERMPAVDRAALRQATYELGWEPEMPTAVVDQRSRRAREAVLHQGFRALRERVVEPHRRGAAAISVVRHQS